MKFAVGDKIVMSEKSRGKYAHTIPGVYGTIEKIISYYGLTHTEYKVKFEYNPITNPKFKWPHTEIWSIDEKYMELVEDFKPLTLEEKVCKKIKQLDLQWALKQKMKGNKVCDALHVTAS